MGKKKKPKETYSAYFAQDLMLGRPRLTHDNLDRPVNPGYEIPCEHGKSPRCIRRECLVLRGVTYSQAIFARRRPRGN